MSTTSPIQTIAQIMRSATPTSAPEAPLPAVVVTGNGNIISLGNLHMPGAVVALNDPAAVPRASGQ